MTGTRFDQDLAGLALDDSRRRRIAETLGERPRDALSALVGYGLSDDDIARYHGLTREIVTGLREFWRLPPGL